MSITMEQVAGWARTRFWGRGEALRAPSLAVKGDATVGGILTAAGIGLGDDVLDIYFAANWFPTLSATTAPTVTYTRQLGRYLRLGELLFYSGRIDIATISGGSGAARLSLPMTTPNTFHHNPPGSISLYGPALHASTRSLAVQPVLNQSYAVIAQTLDNAFVTNLDISAFVAGDIIQYGGFFFLDDPTVTLLPGLEG